MYFRKLTDIVKKSYGFRTKTALYSQLIDICKPACDAYIKSGRKMEAYSKVINPNNDDERQYYIQLMKSYTRSAREVPKKYSEAFYITFDYFFQKRGFSTDPSDIRRVKDIFEKHYVAFEGNDIACLLYTSRCV